MCAQVLSLLTSELEIGFLLKRLIITGTMASILVGKRGRNMEAEEDLWAELRETSDANDLTAAASEEDSEDDESEPEEENQMPHPRSKLDLLRQCANSWFGRHPSSKPMKKGTLNKVPTAEHIETYDWMLEFYEVGLLECKEFPFLGVSPDGVVRISVNGEDESQIACIEIKT